MYDRQNETIFIQSLTIYLQYFKTYFSNAIQLIECHVFPSKFNTLQLENIVQKIYNKKLEVPFSYSPFLLHINEQNKSYIERFYMRIVQFLQYRLNIFKSQDTDSKLDNILHNFINTLHKLFKRIKHPQQNEKQKNIVSLGEIFVQIDSLVQKLFDSIFQYLEKINSKNRLILDQLKQSKIIIQENIFIPFYQTLRKFFRDENSFNHSIQPHQQNKSSIKHHLRSKSEFTLESLQSNNSRSLVEEIMKKNNLLQRNNLGVYGESITQSDQNVLKDEEATKDSKMQKYAKLISIMDIENIDVFSRQYILQDLRTKNAQNKLMISKFRRKCQKKQRKLKRKKPDLKEMITLPSQKFKPVILIEDTQKPCQNEPHEKIQKFGGKIIAISSIIDLKNVDNSKSTTEIISLNKISLNESKYQKAKSQTIRQQIMVKPIFSIEKEFQTNKQTFIYKEKQKLYFQALKQKLNLRSQKISTPVQVKRELAQLQTYTKLNKISSPNVGSVEYRESKMSQKNMLKRAAIKGSNYLSYVTETMNKPFHSNFELIRKKQIVPNYLDTSLSLQGSSTLQGSSLSKRIPKVGKILKIMQSEQINSNFLGKRAGNAQQKRLNSKLIENQQSMIVLPKLPTTRKYQNAQR